MNRYSIQKKKKTESKRETTRVKEESNIYGSFGPEWAPIFMGRAGQASGPGEGAKLALLSLLASWKQFKIRRFLLRWFDPTFFYSSNSYN